MHNMNGIPVIIYDGSSPDEEVTHYRRLLGEIEGEKGRARETRRAERAQTKATDPRWRSLRAAPAVVVHYEKS
jgi:hypothetical protein